MAAPSSTRAAAGGGGHRELRRAAALLAGCAIALGGCHQLRIRDQGAREDVESLQTGVRQIESSLQARQAGINEQIRVLREDQTRLEGLLDEHRRALRESERRIDHLRDKTREDFVRRDRAGEESAKAATEGISKLGARLDTLQASTQKGLQTVNDNLVAMSTFEKQQEERLAAMQERSAKGLQAVVDEVGRENQRITAAQEALRAEIESGRRDRDALRQSLVDLQQALERIASALSAAQADIRSLGRRLETAGAADGQHTVRAGETLTSIAARYGVSVGELMELNGLADANSIQQGQRLRVPEGP